MRRRVLIATGTALVTGLGACVYFLTRHDPQPPAPRPTPSVSSPIPSRGPSPSSSPVTGLDPLTGLAGSASPRILMVKVENSRAARPQSGLDEAQMVVEELVEGGETRFVAVYSRDYPTRIGPVRSVRSVDLAIAAPTNGVLAYSGGAKKVLNLFKSSSLVRRDELSAPASFSRSHRPSPHNLYLNASSLMSGVQSPAAPASYLPLGPNTAGVPASLATLKFSPAHTTRWAWSGTSSAWLRSENTTPSRSATGRRLVATSVLVLRVSTRDAGYRDPIGGYVPESVFTGTGTGILLTRGLSQPVRWTKPAVGSSLALTDASGSPVAVPPGRTWIELLPTSGTARIS